MRTSEHRNKVGEIRPSQLMFSFGIGSSVDLPQLSVMVMGLNDWNLNAMQGKEIGEERLLVAVREVLGPQIKWLLAPPSVPDSGGGPVSPFDESAKIGVPVAAFPRWVRCPKCELLANLNSGLFELKTDPFRPDRARYVHTNCNKSLKPPTVLPARFLVACENGHLDDFPWVEYVHDGRACDRPMLRLSESGASGEAAAVFVKCETCNQTRSMAQAFGAEARLSKECRGRHPHLRTHEEGCDRPLKTILLGASNSWFPITLSAFSIPVATNKLSQLVEEHWPVLQNATGSGVITAFRAIGTLNAFAAYSDDQVWETVEEKRSAGNGGAESKLTDLKAPEWEVFSEPDPALRYSENFRLRSVGAPDGYKRFLADVVLVERLREVHALLGFTRIGSPGDFGEVEEIPRERWVSLSRGAPQWVPASEVRGEGIFLKFNEDEVAKWCLLPEIARHAEDFWQANRKWRQMRLIPNIDAGFPGIRYILLHSLSHALMRQFCLECGYTAASIRERIYAREPQEDGGPMAGILLYTAAPDSEGTLGGLVSLGEPKTLARHIEQALEQIRLCASDPLCAEHHPHQGGTTLHAAACHACLFSPETSCERGNKFLDRSVLVPTFGSTLPPFFSQR
jgi:hypothetical protein